MWPTKEQCEPAPPSNRSRTDSPLLPIAPPLFPIAGGRWPSAAAPKGHLCDACVALNSMKHDTRGQLAIEDLSSNGTFVNGERVPRSQRRGLRSGDQIYLVIPNQDLLQAGYVGSLTSNFVGYIFSYTDGDDGRPQTAPPRTASPQTAEWPPARGLAPLPAPGEGEREEPPAEASCGRFAEVRQTTDAPSWLSAVAAVAAEAGSAGAGAGAAPAQGPARAAAGAATAAGVAADATAGGGASSGTGGGGAAAAGGVWARCEPDEHVSFAQWWLAVEQSRA